MCWVKTKHFLVFFILLLLGLTGCGKRKVVLDKYIEFSSEGYDTKERLRYHLIIEKRLKIVWKGKELKKR